MIPEQPSAQRDLDAARAAVGEFLRRHFGDDLVSPESGPLALAEEFTTEYENAFTFVVQTVMYLETGDIRDSLLGGGIVVPKDGSPVHWGPTFPPIEDYLTQVASGERWWSSAGADPETTVRYYGIVGNGRTAQNPAGVIRRRTAGGRTVDEVFTRDLVWKPTDYFRRDELGHNDEEHVEITAEGAAAFVRKIRAKAGK